MTVATNNLKNTLADKAGMGPPEPKALSPLAQRAKTVEEWVNQIGPMMSRALPRHVNLERLQRVWLTEIRRNLKLLECTKESLVNAMMLSAQLGLEPGPLGLCYPVPFKNNAKKCQEVQFIVGYKGMINLSRRSGELKSIRAMPVFANDIFKLVYGNEVVLEHIPWHLREDISHTESGKFRGAYMAATFKDGGYHIGYLSAQQIEKEHRSRSRAKDSGPWVTDYISMCLKTVIRDNWKWLPYDVEIMDLVLRGDDDRPEIPEIVPFTVEDTDSLPEPPASQEPAAQAAPDSDFTAGAVHPDFGDKGGFQ